MTAIARTAATGGSLDPRFLEWQTSLPIDRRLLEVDCAGSVAHVEGQRAAGLLTDAEAAALTEALRSLPARVARGEVVLPDDEEDVHMAIEAWLGRELGPLAAKLHAGRSRNDQVATDLKLWARGAVATLRARIADLEAAVGRFIERFGDTPMPAYTHRQVAIPALARLWIRAALTEPLRRDVALLDAVDRELATSPLGAGAIGGTTLPIDPAVTAAALGFAGPPTNPIDAVGERDHALTLVFVCARVGLHLGRFASDVVELCADGLVTLGGAIACGSSMMPHKRNPDLFELVRGQAALRQGELCALMATFHGLGSGYHRDLQQDKQLLFSAVDGAASCLEMITLGLGHLELRPDKCLAALAAGDAIATDLAEALVTGGLAFRDAYLAVGRLVAAQRERGRRLADLTGDDLQRAGLPTSLLDRLDLAQSARTRAQRYR
ncbi:MAG: argininosuccinate lyase [Myxococcales bacterium]|nr:argininosuccinate lyase [Myxococcales bacterium]